MNHFVTDSNKCKKYVDDVTPLVFSFCKNSVLIFFLLIIYVDAGEDCYLFCRDLERVYYCIMYYGTSRRVLILLI